MLAWVVLTLAIGFAMAAGIYVRIHILVSDALFIDWQTYATAVGRLVSGGALYVPRQLLGPYELPTVAGVGYAYPPSSVPLMLPFLTWPVGTWAWMVVNIGALITGLAAVLRREFGRLDPLVLAVVVLGLAAYVPFGVGFATLNANVGLAGLLAWAWALDSPVLLGLLAGVGGALKLLPAAVLGLAPRGSRGRSLLTALSVGAVIALAALPFTGLHTWWDYARALSNSIPDCGTGSLACAATPLLGYEAAKALGIVVAAIALLLAWWAPSRLAAYSFVTIAWLAPVTDMQLHYLLIVYVYLVVVASHALAVWRRQVSQGNTGRLNAGRSARFDYASSIEPKDER